MRKSILSEKGLVVILFVLVFLTFSFAQQDTKKIERLYQGSASSATPFDKPDNSGTSSAHADIHIPGAQLR
jgi:hypothetical protein